MAGCTGTNLAPVESPSTPVSGGTSTPVAANSTTHTVQRGDTLYGIARRYGLTLNQIVAWNGISPPYSIYPGQRLRVSISNSQPSPTVTTATGTQNRTTVNPSGERIRRLHPGAISKQSQAIPAQPSVPAITSSGGYNNCSPGRSNWQWPTGGAVRNKTASTGRQGIEIFGTASQLIRAAAPGRVVYSGTGLNGYYGNLLIIEHGQAQRSVYAHNRKVLVGESDYVAMGQAIAEMGKNQQNRFALYFEISCFDKSMNPLLFLPRL